MQHEMPVGLEKLFITSDIPDGVHYAFELLRTDGTVQSNATLEAGDKVSMLSGFNVPAGAKFSADVKKPDGIPNFIYYLHDHLGNTRVTYHVDIKASNQIDYTIESATDYYPYGKALRSYGKERYQSTYHERDLESGFDYRGARFYDADVARFNSLDPLAAEYPSWSDYHYVLGNPIMLIDPTGMSATSTHTDKDGNVLAVYDDGDLGVYRHEDATTKEEIDKKRETTKETGGGGKLMGETNYWWDFAAIDTRSDKVSELPAEGAKIHFNRSMDNFIRDLYNNAMEDMPNSTRPDAAARWLAVQASNGAPLDIKVRIGSSNGYLFEGRYVSGRALGNHLFGSVLAETKPWYIDKRAFFTNTMKRVGEFNRSQNRTTFPSDRPFYGENNISGTYIARGYWGKNWVKVGNYVPRNYGY